MVEKPGSNERRRGNGRIRIAGQPGPAAEQIDLGALGDFGAKLEHPQAVQVGAARAGERLQHLEGLSDDTIVELTLDSGARFWQSYERLKADFPQQLLRGRPGESDTLDLPSRMPGSKFRGVRGEGGITSVKTFDLDLAGLFGAAAGALAAPLIAQKFDEYLMPKPRLRRWSVSPDADATTVTAGDLSASNPLLLLLHGTFSSADGSFGNLSLPAASPAEAWRSEAFAKLTAAYGERIIALDHRTLSVSPIENAIQLLNNLPANAKLHIVSHSRGGMIGELLCRAQRTDNKAPFEGELEGLKRWVQGKDTRYQVELDKLAAFAELLAEKKPRVERFVRVACPAAGTTLASGRLDRWLSILTTALDYTGLGGFAIYRAVKGFLLAVIKARTDPRDIPGLEAMSPGSLLTVVLNRPGIDTAADLSVISGDIEGASWLARLGVGVADLFFGGDNDLVVDTVSMYGGIARKTPRYFPDKGSEVHHLAYFRNRKTVEQVVAGLRRRDDEDGGFRRLEQTEEVQQFLSKPRAAGARPTVFLIPGLMGSHLAVSGAAGDAVGDRRVWIDLANIAKGCLAEIAADHSGVTPDDLVAEFYGDIVRHLSQSHEVKPFAYDWRLSLRTTGAAFASELAKRMKEKEPVRIVAHSSGGLVALAALALNTDLRQEFVKRDGSRLLLLGTPLRGSLALARLLLGEDRLTKYLGLLDLARSEDEIVRIFAGFPGVLELLPREQPVDLLDPEWWRTAAPSRAGWSAPDATKLAQAREVHKLLGDFNFASDSVFVYVAGSAPATAVAIEEGPDGRVRFVATARGDGRVDWDTGIPKERVWWAPAEHGGLANYRPVFEAYEELLTTGSTRRLAVTPPAVSGDAPPRFALQPDVALVFPDRRELAGAGLGYHRQPQVVQKRKAVVRVVHGNLAFASWPVAVGHYDGDTISGSEAQLDRSLGGRLTRRRDLRLYPGPIGTSEIVLDPERPPLGAVVIGLGEVGRLAPGTLRQTLANAFRRYSLAIREAGRKLGEEVGISILLIGAGEGGIGTHDAVAALLQSIMEANAMLGDDALSTIEVIELYEDRAIQIAEALNLALDSERFKDSFEFARVVGRGEGGLRRTGIGDDPSWWRRLEISGKKKGGLRFTDLTDRARAPQSLVADQRSLVDIFIHDSIEQRHILDSENPPSSTLFELLLPASLKEESRNDRNLILVLDQSTASYPWELLQRKAEELEEPLSVRAGMIRQLKEKFAPHRPLAATSNKVLVIGDPLSGMDDFPSLDGANNEAERVKKVLDHPPFEVTPRIRETPQRIVSALMNDRWRILHLAGHGAFNYPTERGPMTGMVIGKNLFLTPGTIAQMPEIPELVFLNCCYLGKVNSSAEKKAAHKFHELAGNLGTEFIRLGVRAVVAAGWAVDDAAAAQFADVFYQKLLANFSFGDAVRQARDDVYRAHRGTNTWGAYQCYGDPAFKLYHNGDRRAEHAPSRRPTHIRGVVLELENIAQDAKTTAVQNPAELQHRLDKVLRETPGEWRVASEFLAAAGEAAGALLRLDQAVGYYEDALKAESAAAPMRCVEQLANLRARRAVVQHRDDAVQEIKRSIELLDSLGQLAGGKRPKRGPRKPSEVTTTERLSLLGSCYKRLAQVTSGGERADALQNMSMYYQEAFERGRTPTKLEPYPLLNWILAETLRYIRSDVEEAPPVDDWLRQAEDQARPADAREPKFWNAVYIADAALGRALWKGDLAEPQRSAAVTEAYLRPWRRGGSPLQFASIIETLDFIAAVLDDGGTDSDAIRARLSEALRAIARDLDVKTGVSAMRAAAAGS
jgi:CHAT domain-containing protein